MAGAFTHIMVCLKAKSDQAGTRLDDELWRLLNKHSQFLYLGAVSPDLPYLSFKTGETNWADVMHYESTNGLAISGHAELKKLWPLKDELNEIKLVWLFGYISHLVIDATIHPIVQAIVGPYSNPSNRKPHRICEMTQDSIIFQEVQKGDIHNSAFIDILMSCKKSPHFNDLMAFWAEQLKSNYREKNETPSPSLWFSTYEKAVDVADGDSSLVVLSRHIQKIEPYIYETKETLIKKYPDRYKNYFSQVKLPCEKTGAFIPDGFERAVANVLSAWSQLYAGFTSEIAVANIIKNWDLDTGVDQDSPDKTVTYYA